MCNHDPQTTNVKFKSKHN